MKYYAELNYMNLPKNKANEAAQSYASSVDGTLIADDEALEQFVGRVKLTIDQVNMKFPRCTDLCFYYKKRKSGNDRAIYVDGCLSISFREVKHEFPEP